MWGFLGFIGLVIMTYFLVSVGIYKHFVCLCIALIAAGIIFQIDSIATIAGTLLLGSFFASTTICNYIKLYIFWFLIF